MIVKNEEDFIVQCLESVQQFVQEIIIVDTGSTDQTIHLCQKYNASVFSYEWNHHFADARNYGLSKATGDWILWLDADEKLESTKAHSIQHAIQQTNAFMVYLPIINYHGESMPIQPDDAFIYYQPRLFRNHVGFKFIHRIHETLQPPPSLEISSQNIVSVDTEIYHFGYLKNITEKRNKSQRNLQALLKEYQDPSHSPWIDYHLASEFYRLKQYENAFTYLNESIIGFLQQGYTPPALLYRLKYAILYETGSFEIASFSIEKAILLYPDYVDLHFLKGLFLFQIKNYPAAIASFNKCLELGEHHKDYLITKGVGSFKAEQYKQLCINEMQASKKKD